MGTGSKVASVFLRVLELSSAAIVAGLVGQYLHYVSNAHDAANSRFVYTVTLAGISIVVSLVCMIPLNYAFYGFLLDAALFVMWMTAFGLLVNLTASGGCNSYWYWSSWGYYWGRYYYTPVVNLNQSIVGTAACGKWRATLAWSFIGGWCWFISAIIGAYVVFRIRDERSARNGHAGRFGTRQVGNIETAAPYDTQEIREANKTGSAPNPATMV